MTTLPSPIPLAPRLVVARTLGQFQLMATTTIRAGETIFQMEGVVVSQPTRYTVQIAADEHLDPFQERDLTWVLDHRPYAFMNHSCAPTARIVERSVLAWRDIASGDQITFDYRTTEHTLREPFRCHCGHCHGNLIRGYAHLTPQERQLLEPILAPHART